MQLFISAGNSGPGINTIGDPSVATTSVASVGSSISKETWLANYGSEVAVEQSLHIYSSRGPREDGGFKPNVVAPGLGGLDRAAVAASRRTSSRPATRCRSATPCSTARRWPRPQTAGAAALLLSGTFAEQVPVTPAQLRKALYSSADELPDLPAYAQGMGLIDVPGAFAAAAAAAGGPASTPSSAPVCTPLSDFLATPDTGVGVYNRCAAGPPAVRPPARPGLHRHDHAHLRATAGSRQHTLTWRGNDGTFRTRARVNLPLGTPVTVEVTARPQAGAHGAILLVDDPDTVGIDHQVLNTVVVGTDLTGAVLRRRRRPDASPATARRACFVTVPEGARALQVDLGGIATGSQTRFIAINPYGVPVESTASTDLLHEPSVDLQRLVAGVREPAARHLGARGRGPADHAVPARTRTA